jgi:isoquinoline 1-oxidoreductase subunit beta
MNEVSKITLPELPELTVSRRSFVGGAAGLTFSLSVTGIVSEAAAATKGDVDATVNAYVTIRTDNTITIMSPAAEMGQGIMTCLPLIVAEYMDADWDQVTVENAPSNHKLYGNPKFGGLQYTVASLSVMGYWGPLTMVGAQTRQVLINAAAAKWGVSPADCSTEPSKVVHKSGKSMTYGEIAAFAKPPAEMPKVDPSKVKNESNYRLLGTDVGRVDVPSKTNGSAQYGMDVQIEGMVYASIQRSPVSKAKPVSVNDAEIMKLKGVKRVIKLPYGVAIIGETVEATKNGRDMLEVKWSKAAGDSFTSEKAMGEYLKTAGDTASKGVTWKSKGDVAAGMKGAAKVETFEYTSEHNYHAQMEPMNATARVSADGKSADIWASTQGPTIAQLVSAKVLKTSPAQIRVHSQLIGGGFGRRAQPDFVVDAVLLSKIMGGATPVKVIYSREDDVAAGRMRPMTAHKIDVGMDKDGKIVGWKHRVVGESAIGYTNPGRLKKSGGKDVLVMAGSEIPYYGIANWAADHVHEKRGARLSAWRGIGAGYTKFASEATIDKLAMAAKTDPVDYRMALLNNDKARNVLKAVAEMSDWKRKRKGTALGVSFSELHGAHVAGVAEVSVDSDGKIKVHNFWMAIDPGIALQPDNIVAQTESNIIYGLSQSIKEQVTIEDGAVQQSNFHDYEVFRMADVPNIEVKVMPQGGIPRGIGETGLPPTAGAVANAVRALNGADLRRCRSHPNALRLQ